MTTFRHDDVSPPDAGWLSGPLADTDTIDPPGRGARVLVLAAHPDDETLGAGGLIAAAHARGASVTVVVATDGEASHPHSTTHTPQQLARLRRGEVQHAVARLAADATVHFLGLPDGQLENLTDALTAQVEYLAQGATHLVCPWEGDRHPDHAACARAAGRVAQQLQRVCWQYPIWAWHWGMPEAADLPWETIRRLPLAAHELAAKQRAIGCHVSQHSPLSNRPGDEPIITPGMVAHFERPFETFVVAPAADATVPGYFDALYARSEDPWQLDTRFYEQRKRALLLASLPRPRFRRGFEPGCATGLISAELAARCDELVAWDVAERAVDQTTRRLAGAAHVRVEAGAIPGDWPDGRFDLIVLSEVGYYCVDLDRLVEAVWTSVASDGVVAACHWRHPAPAHPHGAEAVHEAVGRGRASVVCHEEDDFLLHVWTSSGRSVAAETGLIQ